MREYLQRMLGCQKAGNFCCWLRNYSQAVWYRIKYCRSRKFFKVHENTITQNFVFDLALKNFSNIILRESTNEKVNGSDLILFIKSSGHYYGFAIQAKIAYSTGRFESINHRVGAKKTPQVNLLISFAQRNGLYPLYMFYCYQKGKSNNFADYGISVACAHLINFLFLRNGITPKFCLDMLNDLRPIYEWLCVYKKLPTLREIIPPFGQQFAPPEPRAFTEDQVKQIIDSDEWKKIDTASIEDDESSERSKKFRSGDSANGSELDSFSPSFLIKVGQD